MKSFVSKFLIVVMIIGMISGVNVYAEEQLSVYNCGKAVNLSCQAKQSDGIWYINVEDLSKFNLDFSNNEIYLNYSERELKLCPGNQTVYVNGTSILYPGACFYDDDGLYVNINLLANVFSKEYETENGAIRLWISRYGDDFARGTITLNSKIVIPDDGLDVTVFVAEKPESTSGAPQPTESGAGYEPSTKPMNILNNSTDARFLSTDRIASTTVHFDKGSNSAEYALSSYRDDFTKCIIGCYAEIDGIPIFDWDKYESEDELYHFNLSMSKAYIKGRVTLPKVAEENTVFRISAFGNGDFGYTGVIPAGKEYADYYLPVAAGYEYKVSLIFTDGMYRRSVLYTSAVSNGVMSGVDFTAAPSDKYAVTLSLPEGYTPTKDVLYKVYMQSVSEPHYVVCAAEGRIPNYAKSAVTYLYDDMRYDDMICYYVLDGKYDGLCEYGYFSQNGTTFDIDNATGIYYNDTSPNITLLKSAQIPVKFTLPNGKTAENDIYIDCEVKIAKTPIVDSDMGVVSGTGKTDDDGDEAVKIPEFATGDEDVIIEKSEFTETGEITTMSSESASAGGSSGGGGAAKPSTGTSSSVKVGTLAIEKGKDSGEILIDVPNEDGYEFVPEFSVYGDDSCYDIVYYRQGKATAVMEKADTVNNYTGRIETELLEKYELSGYVNAVGYERGNNIIMAESLDGSFAENTVIYGNGYWSICLPSEFDEYVLSLYSKSNGRTIYWRSQSCTENKAEAQNVTVKRDMTDVDFEYDGYNLVLPLTATLTQSAANTVLTVKNISDFKVYDAEIYTVVFSGTGYEKSAKKQKITVNPMSSKSSEPIIDTDVLDSGDVLKIMIWKNMKPLSKPITLNVQK